MIGNLPIMFIKQDWVVFLAKYLSFILSISLIEPNFLLYTTNIELLKIFIILKWMFEFRLLIFLVFNQKF